MDFIEHLPESSGNTSILVIVERLTHQAVFIPCHGKLTSEELARVFLTHVFAKHGAPTNISADRGSEFVSHFFHTLGDLLGIKMHHTSGHHPEANGQAQRTNQTLEQYLRCCGNHVRTLLSPLDSHPCHCHTRLSCFPTSHYASRASPWSPAADIPPISRRVPRRLAIAPYRITVTHLQPHSHLTIYTAPVPTVSSQIRAG